MQIAELFVKLGLDGTSAVKKGLKSVKGGFEDVASSSLQTKAMIAGTLVGLERLMASASNRGMGLYKFSEAFDLSTKKLQEWQYMARKFGAEDQVQGTIEGISRSLTKLRLGEDQGVMRSLSLLNLESEGKDALDILDQLPEKLAKIDPKLGMELVSSLGITPEMFVALRNIGKDRPTVPKSAIMSKEDIIALKDINVQWNEFWFNLRRIGEESVAQYGGFFSEALGNDVKILRDMITGLKDLSEESGEFKTNMVIAAVAIAAAFAPVTTSIAGIALALSEIQKFREGKEGIVADIVDPTGKGGGKDQPFTEAMVTMGDFVADLLGAKGYREAQVEAEMERIMDPSRNVMTAGTSAKNINNTNSQSTNNYYIDGVQLMPDDESALSKQINSMFSTSPSRGAQ